jgi:NAD(P)-dependent dehydrogenase (short-subunit alcohol dehydrogenase family)
MNIATFEMARRMVGIGVTVNCLHPGGVNTHLGTDSARRFYMQWIDRFIKFFMISPEKAADTLVYLAISPAVESVTGQYFVKNKAVLASAACYDPELARRVWDVTNKLVDLKPPA